MFVTLKTLLAKTMRTDSWKLQLISQWPEIVGNLSSTMNLEKVNSDSLVIGVYEAGWLQELYMLSSVLIKTINTHLGGTYIKKIHFKHATKLVGSVGRKQDQMLETSDQLQEKIREKTVLTQQEAQVLLAIKDVELRSVLHLFLSRCKERTKINKKIKN